MYEINKTEAIVLGTVIILATLISNSLNIFHWIYEVSFDLISYNPYVPFVGLFGTWCTLLLILSKPKDATISIAIPLGAGIVYNFFLIKGIMETYTDLIQKLEIILVIEITLLIFITYLVTKE